MHYSFLHKFNAFNNKVKALVILQKAKKMSGRPQINDTTSAPEMMNGSEVTTVILRALPKVTYSSSTELMFTTLFLAFTSVSIFVSTDLHLGVKFLLSK